MPAPGFQAGFHGWQISCPPTDLQSQAMSQHAPPWPTLCHQKDDEMGKTNKQTNQPTNQGK